MIKIMNNFLKFNDLNADTACKIFKKKNENEPKNKMKYI